MKLTLHLRATCNAPHAPAAWFIPGEAPGIWIKELARHDLADETVRVGVVRLGGAGESPSGALVLLAQPLSSSARIAGFPCRLIGRHLCVPIDALPAPELSVEEADTLCGPDHLVFLHPSMGAFGFGEGDLLSLADLLQAPEELDEGWNLARIAEHNFQPLRSIEFVSPPAQDLLVQIFGEEAGRIASESPADLLAELQRAGSEGGKGGLGDGMMNAIARSALEITRRLPEGGTQNGWADRLREWALEKLGREGVRNPREDELRSLRERELCQLMQQLQDNPDTGLQYAIPLEGAPHRGLSEPGTRLPSRNVEFSSSGGATSRADIWELEESTRRRLREMYLTLAHREMALGRFRRAAYIYSELLGDPAAAANALTQGRHFREAAILYEERLHDPLQAARCLAEGGLLREALIRYERLGRLPDAAELYQKLGEPENAAKLWRQVVQEHLDSGNLVGAARLLESRLNQPEEALAALEGGWPHSPQSLRCLDAQCALLDRLGRPRDLLEILGRLQSRNWPEEKWTGLLSVISSLVRQASDTELRARGEDWLRVESARRLSDPKLAVQEVSQIVECLRIPTESDPLLARDLTRFSQKRSAALLRAQVRAEAPVRRTQPSGRFRCIRSFRLSEDVRWIRIQSEGSHFYALGINSARLVVVRGIWTGDFQQVSTALVGMPAALGFQLEPLRQRGRGLALSHPELPGLSLPSLSDQDLLLRPECPISVPAWLPTPEARFVFDESGAWALYRAGHRVMVSHHSSDGSLRRTVDLTDWLPPWVLDEYKIPPGLQPSSGGVAIGVGHFLVLVQPDGGVTVRTCGSAFIRFATSSQGGRNRVALCLAENVEIYEPSGGACVSVPESAQAHAAWFPSGDLVVHTRAGARVVRLPDDASEPVTVVAEFPAWYVGAGGGGKLGSATVNDTLAVLPTGEASRFAVFDAAGRIQVWAPEDEVGSARP